MAERPAASPEGWSVLHRPAVIAGLAVPVALIVLLLAAGWFYDRDLRPATRRQVTSFPAPGLETFIHDGVRDPPRPHAVPTPDRSLNAAKARVAADGIAGWEGQP